MSVWGDDLNGADFNTKRDYGMSVKSPPVNYKWHHHTSNSGIGMDSTVTPLAAETKVQHREMRQAYLDQFDMEITEEGDWRYWRWYTERSGRRIVMWSERRPLSQSLPKVPGFWPADE